MQEIPDKIIGGRYSVIKAFGHGLKCNDTQTDTNVWLKPMAAEIASDPVLLAEAKSRCETLENIHHEGIARMLDVVSDEDGKTYMVIEYVDGVTLRRWMQEHRQEGVVPAKFSMPILKQLSSALDVAHSYNEIHRHLMPENIMVTESGSAKILNLGIPYAGSDNEWMREPWKQTGWEAFYRAPEQWRGQICTTWTDLYALGCIAYEMLSGHVPFDIPDLNLLNGAVLTEMPPAILSLSIAAQGTIARSLAKRPSERFNSCEDYIRSLAFETTPTKTVPKPTSGKVPTLSQNYAVPDIPNAAWTSAPTSVNPYALHPQDTGIVKGTTKHIPIALPSLPPSGPIRTVTGPIPTKSVTKSVTKSMTKTVTGRYSPNSTSHFITDPNGLEADGSWTEENQSVKSVLVRVVMPLVIVLVVASLMYYLFIRQIQDIEQDDYIYTTNNVNQFTPNPLPSLVGNEQTEELKIDEELDTKATEGAKTEEGDSKSSDEASPSPKEETPPPNEQPSKDGDKTDGAEGKATETQPPSAESVTSENDNFTEGLDVNSVAAATAKASKKMPANDNIMKKDGIGTAIIEARIGGKKIRNAMLTIGEKSYVGSVEVNAFISENKRVEVSADYLDEKHNSYHGTLEFAVNWMGKRIMAVEMVKAAGVAVIVTTVDGTPVDGAEVFVDGKSYRTPNCEIETMLDVERKVDVKAFYRDEAKGLMFGSQSFVIDWKGPKTIYVEMKERQAFSSEEKTERLLALNVDDAKDGANDSAETDSEDKPVFMELLWVEPGSFEMGSDSEDAGREEKPRHTVQISNGFWLGKFEVTQEEYRAMARYMGLDNDRSSYVGPRRPVENITRQDAEKWCEAVTRKERDAGRLPNGYEYRLPTEAEWEYAARGGRNSRGYMFSGGNKLTEVAWFDGNRGEDGTKDVGRLEKNELGFYDMSGNVREWCYDRYENYTLKPVTDPLGRGEKVVARGGSWRNNMRGNRVTERANYEPNMAEDYIGFRVALAPVLED